MHKFVAILIATFIPGTLLFAQSEVMLDSLLHIIETNISANKKVDAYFKVMDFYKKKDISNAIKYANLAIHLADSLKRHDKKARALITLAELHQKKSNYQCAVINYRKAADEFKRAKTFQKQVVALNKVAIMFALQGSYKQALEYNLQALKIQQSLKDERYLAMLHNDIGTIYLGQENEEKALEYFLQALKIKKKIKSKDSYASSYNNIGIIYERKGDYATAAEYYNKSMAINKELQDWVGVVGDYNNFAMLCKTQKNYSKAVKYALKAKVLAEKVGDERLIGYPILTLGEIYVAQEKWKLAKPYLIEGLQISKETKNRENVRFALEELARVEAALGNYKEAYEYHVFFKQVADSLQNKEQTKNITRLEMNYEFQQEKDSIQFANEQERLLLEKDIENQKATQQATGISVALLLVLLVILLLYARNKQKSNTLLKQKSEELKISNDEISIQNEEIKKQAEQIAFLNNELEKRLDETVQRVFLKNEKLLEYAHYNSHQTRAPISRLLGLVEILPTEHIDEETAFILKSIKLSATELDEMTRKMNRILEEAGHYD